MLGLTLLLLPFVAAEEGAYHYWYPQKPVMPQLELEQLWDTNYTQQGLHYCSYFIYSESGQQINVFMQEMTTLFCPATNITVDYYEDFYFGSSINYNQLTWNTEFNDWELTDFGEKTILKSYVFMNHEVSDSLKTAFIEQIKNRLKFLWCDYFLEWEYCT